jgi:dTDP-4-dehydrorhamnose 3,5-epimerase-like enzyme
MLVNTDRESTLALARIIELPQRNDERGGLGFVEASRQIPFDVKRVYYMYDLAPGAKRGAHAHKELEQLVIAANGSFTVVLNDGADTRRFQLDTPAVGLYVPRMLWRDLTDFSSNAFCLVLASEYYDEHDYYRDYDDFLRARGLR